MVPPMSKRHPNYRLVKIHRSYTVDEAARLLDAHKNTVRRWVKEGLAINDERRPMLILGRELFAFLKQRRAKNKRICAPGEIYCVRCREPRRPAGDMAEYRALTATLGNLLGICPSCEAMMNRRVNVGKIASVCGHLQVTMPKELLHIGESDQPTLNSDFK